MMKIILTLLFVLPFRLFALELRPGDILLQPLDCWSCSLIEAQEESTYSHMGMVLETQPEVVVIEALGKVRRMTLAEFNARTEKGQKLSVRRFRHPEAQAYLRKNKEELKTLFATDFEGLLYDHDFLWNNFDEEGRQKLYCSEMITKLLQYFLNIELPIKRMKFDKNRDQWIKYFKGTPPDGKWGNSPASFENSELFYEVGEI